MRTTIQTWAFAAFLTLALAPLPTAAQVRRDSTRREATSAEELHRIRRAWLEQRRMGTLGNGPSPFGSAVVGAPRAGVATGVGGPFGPRDFDRDGLGSWRGDRLPYPAYPLYGRFYHRFNPDARRWGGWIDPLLFGVQEYGWGGWYGPWQSYPGPLGWSDGAYGWYSASPWSQSPSDCVDLTLLLANGRSHRLVIGLQPLGLSDARDLDLAIDARLSEGLPVLLQGLDGRVLRIEPGTPIDDILVRPCGG
jgi:hypothetical protein